nr:glyoxalase [uncultured Arsenicibacter sp.]
MDTTKQPVKSLRAFVGAKDYAVSRAFYRDLGFDEHIISEKMSLFTLNDVSFYLQDYYVKEWVENTMILIEVDNADDYLAYLRQLGLETKYENIHLVPTQYNDWGNECLLIDPAGVLWHFAQFFR